MSFKTNIKAQPWIYSALVDGIFILSPPFLSLLIVFIFQDYFTRDTEVPVEAWIVLVVFIDVAHVYSTLYRTYFDKETFQKHASFLIYLPLFCWITGVLLYAIDSILFWRALAYLAVYHFIRQQYGFLKIYTRKDASFSWIDKLTIYISALYPILYWHLHEPRNFNWFIEGDFIYFNSGILEIAGESTYILILFTYFIREIILTIKHQTFNFPKNLIVAGTILSWYFGIVYFNADLAFTTLNVVAHGIPYMALVWVYGRKKYFSEKNLIPTEKKTLMPRLIFSLNGILLFSGIILFLAYFEEGLWDALVWNEHENIFSIFYIFQSIKQQNILSLIVPLLSVPQIMHYIIDGFIWRMRNDTFNWKNVVLGYND